MEKNLKSWHNSQNSDKVLFLVSLPKSKKRAMALKNFSYQEAINKIRRIDNVVLFETINRDFFANACDYRLIVVISHYNDNKDSLVLSDESLFPMKAIPESINESFDGIIDLSSCRSSHIKPSIKSKCPNCHVLSTNDSTGAELRLFIYPRLLDYIKRHPEVSYYDAYQTVLKEIYEKQLKHKTEITTETTKLGLDSLDSDSPSDEYRFFVYAPPFARIDKSYMIQVHLHFNSETGKAEVEVEAQNADSDAVYRTSKQCNGLSIGDIVDVSITFPYGDKENPYAEYIHYEKRTKAITCSQDFTHVEFSLVVTHAYPDDDLNIRLLMLKRNGDAEPIELYFNVPILRFKLDERLYSLIENLYGEKNREKLIGDYQKKLEEWNKIENNDETGLTILSNIKKEYIAITKKGEPVEEEERKILLCRLCILEKRLEMLIAYKKIRILIESRMKKVDRQVEIRKQATLFFAPLVEYCIDFEVYNMLRPFLKKDNKDLGVIQNKVVGVGQTVGTSYATKVYCALLIKMANPAKEDLYFYSYTPGHGKNEEEEVEDYNSSSNAIVVHMIPSFGNDMITHKNIFPQIDISRNKKRSPEESKRQAYTRDVLPYIKDIFNDNKLSVKLKKYLESEEGKTSVFAYYLYEALNFYKTQCM